MDKELKVKSEIEVLRGEVAALTKELELQKRKFSLLYDINADGLFIHENFIIKEVNSAFAKMMGYTPDEMVGIDGKKLLSDGVLPDLKSYISEGFPNFFDLKMKTKSGKLIDVVTKGGSIGDGDNMLRAVFVQDVTEIKKTQKDLEESEERHRMVSSLLSDYVYSCRVMPDQPPKIGWISGGIDKISGYSTEEIEALEHGWYSVIHPEDVARIAASLDVNYSENKFYDNEYRIIDKSGAIRWMLDTSMCVKVDESTKEIVLLGATKDITERKRIEEDLRVRNHELNSFVYKVSHDLRAPLSSIKGLINLSKHDEDKDVYMPKIEDRINRLDEFIRDILSHSRNLNTEVTVTKIDLELLIDQAFSELEYLPNFKSIDKKINIQKGSFSNDKIRVTEICRNLISNAIKYQDIEKPRQFIRFDVQLTEESAVITVEDNGVGIDIGHVDHIFDMFYRATETSEGSGIGLYIVKQAVEKLNGSVSFVSKKDEGTTFTVVLPNLAVDK